MATLDSLTPTRRTQYESLIPEIERSVRNAQNARGGFYSGAAVDAEARAKADLLARLAGQDASEQAQASESARDRSLTEKLRREEIKAGKRNAMLGILGSGFGAAATLGGLAYMNPKGAGGGAWQSLGDGRLFNSETGAIMGAPSAGVVGQAPVPSNMTDPLAGAVRGGPMTSPLGGEMVRGGGEVAPSMWKNAAAPRALGAGALGGGLGYLGARGLGAEGTGAAVGSGLGGLGGYLAGARYGGGNPWAAGAGALFGSFGGGLLGNLFK